MLGALEILACLLLGGGAGGLELLGCGIGVLEPDSTGGG